MHNAVAVLSEKVMGTARSMVYLAMRISYRSGATVAEISGFLDNWMPADTGYPESTVESILRDLQREGKVACAGARWYLAGQA